MPYISQRDRAVLDPLIKPLFGELISCGQLNYVISRLVGHLWQTTPSYLQLATLTGVLQNVSSELYRRVGVAFEDKKIQENGDLREFAEFADPTGHR